MKSYKDYTLTEDAAVSGLETDTDGELTEGAMRGLSAVALIARIRKLSADVKRAKGVDKKLELVASQNTHLAALVFAMTQLSSKPSK